MGLPPFAASYRFTGALPSTERTRYGCASLLDAPLLSKGGKYYSSLLWKRRVGEDLTEVRTIKKRPPDWAALNESSDLMYSLVVPVACEARQAHQAEAEKKDCAGFWNIFCYLE